MKFIFTLLLGFILLQSYSQKNNVAIYFCPLALGDHVSFPTIQAGLAFTLSNKISLYNEAGIKYKRGYYEKADTDSNFTNSGGFKVKTEIRFLLTPEGSGKQFTRYAAVNAFFTQDHHNTEIEYLFKGDTSTPFKADAFGVNKKVFGLNFVYGLSTSLSKKIFVDMYCGIGFRLRNITTVNKEYNYKRDGDIRRPYDFTIDTHRQAVDAGPAHSNAPNLTLGIRLYCKL